MASLTAAENTCLLAVAGGQERNDERAADKQESEQGQQQKHQGKTLV